MRPADFNQAPGRYGLFAALKQLEQQGIAPVPLGRSRRRSDEPLAISQPAHVTFAHVEVGEVVESGGRLDIQQYAFGLLGPNGALPLHVSQLAVERTLAKDPATTAFLNLFHHRMASLFYRAWADSEPTVGINRSEGDAFATSLLSLAGVGTPGAKGRGAVPDVAKARGAVTLGSTVRSAEGLQNLLSDYFGLPVQVRCFVGEWLEIPRSEWCRLGAPRESNCLGGGATLGSGSWQRGQRFEIRIGPLDATGLETFRPGSPALRELADWVKLHTHDEWAWSLRLSIAAHACGGVYFRKKNGPEEADLEDDRLKGANLKGAHLGWNSWLGRRHGSSDDVVLRGETLSAQQSE